MIKRLTILAGLFAFALGLGGCSKCGFWWNESMPRNCRGDVPK